MNTTIIDFNQICDFPDRRILFSIPIAEYASFHVRPERLKPTYYSLISILLYYFISRFRIW